LVKEEGKVKQKGKMARTKPQPDWAPAGLLPEPFAAWFAGRGWRPRAHQLALLELAQAGRDALLIAPTGGGKTLAGFLPSLVALNERQDRASRSIHTLYVSPLKALATDIARNLSEPVAEMGLPITLETRTGDTPAGRRARQRVLPPDILLTTPEQIALMLSHPDAPALFASLGTVIIDELHALSGSKRGDLLSLDLARLRKLSPGLKAIGLSATVARPSELAAFLVGHEGQARTRLAEIVEAAGGVKADISILDSQAELPWAGHSARYALPEIYEAIKSHRLSLMFVNTRSQAEMLFHALWALNDENLPIALHHGSLDVGQRRKVEAAMVAGKLRAVVCTSTLDLGIDWGDVDLVINVGAPKAQAAWRSASAAPTTGSTSRARRCSCRRTVSRWSNAAPPSKRRRRGRRTPRRRARARSMCSLSTCSAWPVRRRSTPTSSIAR
jgi:ATP-dependent Lhr-like helicase